MDPAALTPEGIEELAAQSEADPVFHIEQVQGVTTLEPYQERIARAVWKYERVAVSACHDVGKTYTTSKIVLAFTSTFPGAKVITTAPTFVQVEKLLWSEIRSGYSKSKYPLGGRMLTTNWQIDDDWFAIGLSPREEADTEGGQGRGSSFQGFHAEHILVVFDEATGVPASRWVQAEGMLTSGHVRFLAIGNPTSRSSEFFRCFNSPIWHKIHLSCFDSPNLIANGIVNLEKLVAELDLLRELPEEKRLERLGSYKIVHPKLLTTRWVMEAAIKWGITHPLFLSKVLGTFPTEDDHTLIPLATVESAQIRSYEPQASDPFSIGADIARYGTDKTILTALHGYQQLEKKTLVKRSTSVVSGEIIQMIRAALGRGIPAKKIVVVVDGTGIGSGVVDQLEDARTARQIPSEIGIREVHFGEGFDQKTRQGQEDHARYVNLKAKMFVELAEDLKENLCLTQDSVYPEELPTIRFTFDKLGRYQIESKDEYKARTGRSSPDDADSLALANHGRRSGSGSGFMPPPRTGNTRAGSLRRGDAW